MPALCLHVQGPRDEMKFEKLNYSVVPPSVGVVVR